MYLILVSVFGTRVYIRKTIKNQYCFFKRNQKWNQFFYYSIILNFITIQIEKKIENIVIYLAAIQILKHITSGCPSAVCVNKILLFAANFFSQILKLLLKFNNHFISNKDQEEKAWNNHIHVDRLSTSNTYHRVINRSPCSTCKL